MCIYIYGIMGYYSSLKNHEILLFSTANGPRDYYAKWNKSDIEIQIPYEFTKQANIIKQKQIYRFRKLTDSCQRKGSREMHEIGERA